MAEHLAFLAFAVCGLGQPLVSINGDQGLQRRPRARYRAGLLEQLSLGNGLGMALPQQLPAVSPKLHERPSRSFECMIEITGCGDCLVTSPSQLCAGAGALRQCCLPGGVEVLLPVDADPGCASSAPLIYSVVLTGERGVHARAALREPGISRCWQCGVQRRGPPGSHNAHNTPGPDHRPLTFAPTDESGKRLYASCLSYMDTVPALLASRHEHLLGAKATCALCLLCRQPYLATAEQVKQRHCVLRSQIRSKASVRSWLLSIATRSCRSLPYSSPGAAAHLRQCLLLRLLCPYGGHHRGRPQGPQPTGYALRCRWSCPPLLDGGESVTYSVVPHPKLPTGRTD